MVEISDYIISFTIFTLFIVCGIGIIGELTANNPSLLTDDTNQQITNLNTSINQYNSLSTSISQVQGNLSSGVPDDNSAFLGSINSLFKVGWTSMHLILTSWTFIPNAFVAAGSILGIPSYVVVIIVLLGTLVIIFGIIKLITRTVI